MLNKKRLSRLLKNYFAHLWPLFLRRRESSLFNKLLDARTRGHDMLPSAKRLFRQPDGRKRCMSCGNILDAIWFTALMTEEWSWNGEGYKECTARHSLVTDPQANVICPHCENTVGTGWDFGF